MQKKINFDVTNHSGTPCSFQKVFKGACSKMVNFPTNINQSEKWQICISFVCIHFETTIIVYCFVNGGKHVF